MTKENLLDSAARIAQETSLRVRDRIAKGHYANTTSYSQDCDILRLCSSVLQAYNVINALHEHEAQKIPPSPQDAITRTIAIITPIDDSGKRTGDTRFIDLFDILGRDDDE